MAAFAAGLGLDSKNTQLLSGLVDAVSKSPLKGERTIESMINLQSNTWFVFMEGQFLLMCSV